MPEKPNSTLVIGGGAWGLSVALELARNGYTNVRVVDPHQIPSPIAAGNDVNKIVETPDDMPVSTDAERALKRSLEIASEAWFNDPVFKPHFHQTGVILSSSSPEAFKGLGDPEDYEKSSLFTQLSHPEEFRSTMPEGVLTGPFTNWKGWYRRQGAGWCHARKTLESAYTEAQKLGVEFVMGADGDIAHLIIDDDDDGSVVKGARARNGTEHRADLVVLAAGSYSNEIFDFKNQLRPTAWTLAHIKMTPEELKLYKNLPVLFNNEQGFFMEPDFERGELKMCDEHPGYINPVPASELPEPVPSGPCKQERSIPFARQGLPSECEIRLRHFLANTMPQLQSREFIFGRICWDADTVDRVFLIDRPTGYQSLIVAVGASGHGIMNMPAIGKIVRSIIEGTREEVFERGFRWRPEIAEKRDLWDKQHRFGYDEYNRVMNFREVKKWLEYEQRD